VKLLKSTIRKPIIITWLVIAIIGFTSSVLHAQTLTSIHGVIKNQDTYLPIEGVNIQLQNTNIGTSTNDKGIFELRIRDLPVVLTITHISFFGKQIIATLNTVDSMIILLDPRVVTLTEAEITAETYKVFKGSYQEIIDYNFLDTNILILSYNNNKNRHELIFLDDNFDTINIKDISYLKKPEQLYKDCMGCCHLLTKDSAYQVYSDYKSTQLIYPIHLDKFYSILGDCLFETSTHIAFKNKANNNLKKEYAAIDMADLPSFISGDEKWKQSFYLINKKTRESTVLDQVNEWQKKRDAFDHALFVADGSRRHFGDILRFAEMVYYKPAFQSLQTLNDTIYYFNHLKSQIDIFSVDLVLLKSIHVEYHNQKNWKPIIIIDNEKSKAYTIFTSGAMYSLAEINLRDGLVKEVAKIKKLFPQKIKVNNGQLYFLYKDVNNIWDKRKLYQGELPNL
jgi:hypothetical protein